MAHTDATFVCLSGPESSGKTTLARDLANVLDAPLVSEFARKYLTQADYGESDLVAIARGQLAAEQAVAAGPAQWVVLDTDIQVIETWWWYRFAPEGPLLAGRRGAVAKSRMPSVEDYPAWLRQGVRERTPRLYLLAAPDLPWEDDPLRQNPHDREALFDHYKGLMHRDGLPYGIVSGSGQLRLERALALLEPLQRRLSS